MVQSTHDGSLSKLLLAVLTQAGSLCTSSAGLSHSLHFCVTHMVSPMRRPQAGSWSMGSTAAGPWAIIGWGHLACTWVAQQWQLCTAAWTTISIARALVPWQYCYGCPQFSQGWSVLHRACSTASTGMVAYQSSALQHQMQPQGLLGKCFTASNRWMEHTAAVQPLNNWHYHDVSDLLHPALSRYPTG